MHLLFIYYFKFSGMKNFVFNGEEYLSIRQLAEREGFSLDGMKYRVKKLGIGKKFQITNGMFVSLKDVERCEKEGLFAKFR